jgi:hypothetical protein
MGVSVTRASLYGQCSQPSGPLERERREVGHLEIVRATAGRARPAVRDEQAVELVRADTARVCEVVVTAAAASTLS